MPLHIPHPDTSSRRHMAASVLAGLPKDPHGTPEDHQIQRDAALAALATLAPNDPVETLMGARIVASHHYAMDCFRRAAQPEVPDTLSLKLQTKALALSRLSWDMQRALEARQGMVRTTRHGTMVRTPRHATGAGTADTEFCREDLTPSEPPAVSASPLPPAAPTPVPEQTPASQAQTGRPQTGRPQTGRPQTGRPQTGRPQTRRPEIASASAKPPTPHHAPQIARKHPMPSEQPAANPPLPTVLDDIRGPNLAAWQARLDSLPRAEVLQLFTTLLSSSADMPTLLSSVSHKALLAAA
jgi:hypothetical protein